MANYITSSKRPLIPERESSLRCRAVEIPMLPGVEKAVMIPVGRMEMGGM
jgi:hypothetical protein